MGGACCLHDTGVQKLTLNMLCSFLTSPGEGRPQHNITGVLGCMGVHAVAVLCGVLVFNVERTG